MAYRKPATKAGEKKQKFELTEEQKQEIREAFDLFDTDGSGASFWQEACLSPVPPVPASLGQRWRQHVTQESAASRQPSAPSPSPTPCTALTITPCRHH